VPARMPLRAPLELAPTVTNTLASPSLFCLSVCLLAYLPACLSPPPSSILKSTFLPIEPLRLSSPYARVGG